MGKGNESQRGSVEYKEEKAQKMAQKKDANMKKAKARIQQQDRPVVLRPIKAELKERPITILSAIFFLTLLVSAFVLRATEMPKDEAIDSKINGFKEFGNSIWCTFITVMTSKISNCNYFLVGYGDYYASTIMGRCWTVFIMFWGNFI